MSESKGNERILRFPVIRRIEHWLTAISFTVLAVTGLPQKYADARVSETMIGWMGGIESVRIIHRVAAVVLAFVAIYHVGAALHHWYVKRGKLTMLLTKQDALNAWQSLRFNLGLEEERPKQGFYTFEEKAEYWALIWGTLVMVVTGFFLWNPITAARWLPGEFIPAAKAAHGGEALLAALAIILWHLYHVLVRHFNKSMFTGYLSREEWEEEHPLALEDEGPEPAFDLGPGNLTKRRRQFWIGYGIVATIWLVGVFWFVTSEQTARASPEEIPDLNAVEVYAPLTPTPLPDPIDEEAAVRQIGSTWDGGIGEAVIDRCGDCHGPRFGEGNLNLTTYEGALQGGDSGPAVVPNSPGQSLILIWPGLEDHPGKFSPAELAAIRAWIRAGAPK